jgi:signal transduction histidine kinase
MKSLLGTQRMTTIVLRGSLLVTVAMIVLLILHGLISDNILIERIVFGLIIFAYLFAGELFARKQKYIIAGWMIMCLYTVLGILVMLLWGINAPVGVLVIGFVIFLSGVMLGPKYIFQAIVIVILLLCSVQYLHTHALITPELAVLSKPSDYFDVLTYATILSIFALLSWLSGKQTERSLQRAFVAEQKLKAEKNNLANKLEEQSRLLREAHLKDTLQFYKFAEIGQTTTATLHELSNLLSILTLDIDDLSHRHQRSKAIVNAREGVSHINQLIRQTRKQLNESRDMETFDIKAVVEKVTKELEPKFQMRNVMFDTQMAQSNSYMVYGDAMNFSHVILILLKNALDASTGVINAKVVARIEQDENGLSICVLDNGPGVSENTKNNLFKPHRSNKSDGLGIGLFMAKHIIESQFGGTITYVQQNKGACFKITLPRNEGS